MEEGRNRIVRRLCEAIGHPVLSLNRVTLGPLELSNLPRGKTRILSAHEIYQLRKSVGLAAPRKADGAAAAEKPAPGRMKSRMAADPKHHARPADRRGQGPRQPHEKAPRSPRRSRPPDSERLKNPFVVPASAGIDYSVRREIECKMGTI